MEGSFREVLIIFSSGKSVDYSRKGGGGPSNAESRNPKILKMEGGGVLRPDLRLHFKEPRKGQKGGGTFLDKSRLFPRKM